MFAFMAFCFWLRQKHSFFSKIYDFECPLYPLFGVVLSELFWANLLPPVLGISGVLFFDWKVPNYISCVLRSKIGP